MNIFVTGSAGFIGSTLCHALLEEGHTITGFDNFNDYYSVQLKRDRHALLESREGYTGIQGDLADTDCVMDSIGRGRFDVVVNLAAQAGVRYSIENPHAYQASNSLGFLNILEACRHGNVPRCVYASSSSVYGGNTKLPFSEGDRVDTPISMYAATKKANELMAHTYTHLYKFQTIGLRFFTVYGPWGRPDMALWLFTKAMVAGEPINVFNNGEMLRDFTYIDDIVAGTKAAVLTDGLDPYEIFNLGNHRCEKLMDMIQTLSDALGIEPQMNMMPMQMGDVQATHADVKKAGEKLGFSPATPISEGIPKFVAWYQDYHGI